jgi:hypothetical protein
MTTLVERAAGMYVLSKLLQSLRFSLPKARSEKVQALISHLLTTPC